MAKTIKIRCNEKAKHINEFDEHEIRMIIGNTFIVHRINEDRTNQFDFESIPERFVVNCKKCHDGEVIITREMIKTFLQDKN